MEQHTITHGAFVVERSYAHSRSKMFECFSNIDKKKSWFVDGPKNDVVSYTLDFQVGGEEKTRWKWSSGGPIEAGTLMGNDTVYLDIVENSRIVLAYSMIVGNHRFSSSLLTFEFIPDGRNTTLRVTEQGAYFENSDGAEMREGGWRALLELLGTTLDANI